MLDRGLVPEEIGRALNVSRTSVGRALKAMGVASRHTGRPRREERSEYGVEESTALLSQLDRASHSFLQEAVRILLRTEIPLSIPTPESVTHDIGLLRRAPTKLEGGTFHHVSRAGSVLCSKHFSYRWDARYRDKPSVRAAWYDEELIRSAIRFPTSCGGPHHPDQGTSSTSGRRPGPDQLPSFDGEGYC